MKAILSMAAKDLRLLLRDFAGLFWLLAFPLIMALFFGSIFGGFGDSGGKAKIRVVMVDQTDGMQYAEAFRAKLGEVSALEITASTYDSAQSLVRRGKRQAYVALKPKPDSIREEFSFYPGGIPQMEVGIDPSRAAETEFLKGMLTRAHFELVMAAFTDTRNMRSLLSEGIAEIDSGASSNNPQARVLKDMLQSVDAFFEEAEKDTAFAQAGLGGGEGGGGPFQGPDITVTSMERERTGPRSSFEITFPQALLWGLLGCVAAFSMSIVTERTRGTYLRLRLAPISRGQIIGGKALACLIAAIAVCCILLAIGIVIFDVSMHEPLKLALAVVAAAICFTGLMMTIAVIGKTEQAVGGAGWAIMLIFSMTGGGMVPLLAMPSWMLQIGAFSPVRWGITALEGAIWRGYSYSEMMLPVGILVAIGVAGFALGTYILTKRDS